MLSAFHNVHQRPFLKLCEQCHGKGQIAGSYDGNQSKVYAPCKHCSKKQPTPPSSLGIKLKCTCKEASAQYDWVHAKDASHFRSQRKDASLEQLLLLQESLPEDPPRQALLLSCECGAEYLCVDGPNRCKLRGGASSLKEDKTFNKNIAKLLVENGILTELNMALAT